ncbi:MAG: AIPR family protein [Candidatus Hodarchaeota archaeon]
MKIQFRPALYTLDTLIDERWREQNREWRDKEGKHQKSIDLHPYDGDWVGAKQDVVFYCPAIDLVNAYEDFGYQIFEPNVRAHIRKSRVNAAIEESVKRRASRREFRLLNNGVTITCSGYSKPTDNRPSFRVREPGIVNGLQTVVALHTGYKFLSHSEKVDFEESCYVLVRLLQRNAVRDIGKVVLATNTQNTMQPRNLTSNRSEQLFFEQLFAERGWFYERKQGAWDAFSADPGRWRTLQNKKPQHFKASAGRGRPKYKRVDNEDLAQTWLAFAGFSREAADLKRELFEEKWYEFIFLRRLPNHASEYDYSFEKATAESLVEAPDVNLMLLSWLAREMARAAAPSAKKNRDAAIQRLDLDRSKLTREEIEVALARDYEYTIGQVLRGASLLFVELLGYVLYRSLGNPHTHGATILAGGIAKKLKEEFDLESVVSMLESDDFEPDDTIAVIWKAFLYIVENLAYGPWGDSYRAAPVKFRFLLSQETRRRFTVEFDRVDEFLQRREVPRAWAAGISERQGLYGFISSSLQA